MGCASSKQVKASVIADVYKPPPSSFALFDINTIEEPWLKLQQQDDDDDDDDDDDKPTNAALPNTVLDTLESDDAPKTWDEVSKSLETQLKPPTVKPSGLVSVQPPVTPPRRLPRKSASFHTLDELESRARRDIAAQNPTTVKLKKTESMSELRPESDRTESTQSNSGSRSVKENIFVLRDRERREKEGNKKPVMNWDPLREFPEKYPPRGSEGLVVYTTSLQGVRRTYEDCMRVRAIMEQQGVVVDERDVSLDAGVLSELKELLQEEATVAPPRVFVKGRYIGGATEVTAMNENGKLGRVLRWARVERVGEEGRQMCDGCGGARWLPCLECGGSCKVVGVGVVKSEGWERCEKCNENGLIRCPLCFVN